VEFIGLREIIEQAIGCIRVGGRVVVVGLGPEIISFLHPLHLFELNYHFLFLRFDNVEIQNVINLVASGKLNLSDSITERFSLEEVNKGLDHLYKKIGNPIRVVIEID